MEDHLLTTGNIPEDVLIMWDMKAYLEAERLGFPRPDNLEIGSMWWGNDGRHYIDKLGVERYVPKKERGGDAMMAVSDSATESKSR